MYGVEEEQKYKIKLNQAYIAKEFTKWLKQKAQIKSVTNQRIQGGLYHVEYKDGTQIGLVGGAPFSSPGLGYSNSSSMYINNIVDDAVTNAQLIRKFDAIWQNEYALQDVKEQLLRRLEVLYKENSPEFI